MPQHQGRPDLDLRDIIPAYEAYLFGGGTSTAGVSRVRATPWGDVVEEAAYEEEPEVDPFAFWEWSPPEEPMTWGAGPTLCSTSQEVALAGPAFAWDVNGWYRTIGVPFPYVDATQGALSKAYIVSEGQSSARATYYLKRLLDRDVRALYDTAPLGQPFLDDDYVQDELKARAAHEAARRSKRGDYTSAETVMDEWGYRLDEHAGTGVDKPRRKSKDLDSPEELPEGDPSPWMYSIWLWRTQTRPADVADLESWQTMLVRSAAGLSKRTRFAVGVAGKIDQPFLVTRVHDEQVVFIREGEEATQDLADQAAAALDNTD